ncbi:S-layer homology domain-containing protein [Paenibacillus agaridevorans]|uniref:S-layer homology domain-containing protein n=1 Tax=Paenibacillus agaridevorans TaxID=171404 RepID=UPI001BE47342|nr:S-layer homology domain-containing protein [Paenibacillus agaridevorans]
MLSLKRFQLSLLALLLIIQVAIPGVGSSVYAAADNFITFKYDSFSDDGRLKTNGVTSYYNGRLRLTPAAEQKWGTAFNMERVSLKNDRSFSSYFTFQITNGGGYDVGWADGIVFTVQTFSNAAGAAGGGMGYQGIQQSVGIEFDTWNNGTGGDTNSNHIGINFNGVLGGAIPVKELSTSTLNMKSGTIHAWVDYDGINKKIEIRVNKDSDTRPTEATLAQNNVNLTSILSSSDVYVGFTAATGGAYQNHDITKWYFTNDFAPIDVRNNTYVQAPTRYTIAKTEQEDGRWKLDITAVGGTRQSDIPITVTATNDAIVEPSSVVTDANGKAVVYISSSGTSGPSTVKAEGPSGIFTTADVTLVGKSTAPLAQDIIANATDQQLTLNKVPAGAVISIYRSESDSEPLQITSETGGTVELTAKDLSFSLSSEENIYITYQTGIRLESDKTAIRPKVRSGALAVGQIVSNGTKDTVYVADVPAGATVRIYDPVSGELIGEAAAAADPNPLALTIADGLLDLQQVEATIQNHNEIESHRTSATTRLETSDQPVHVTANSATNIITVEDVPSGAKVIVYDKDGDEIASIYNRTANTRDMVFDMFPPGIELGDHYEVSIIEVKKYESDKVGVDGKVPSQSLAADQLAANATTDTVTAADIAPGTIVRVYDANGVVLGQAVNEGSTAGDVVVDIAEDVADDQLLFVTQQAAGELESAKTSVIAHFDQSAAPIYVAANATDDTVTVTNVPAGATVTVYDEDDEVIGTGTNNGAAAGTVIVEIENGLNDKTNVKVTITEPNKSESEPTTVAVLAQSEWPNDSSIVANGTEGTVTVSDVPAEATIIVYDKDGKELGRLKQGETADSLTLENLQGMGEEIYVSILIDGQLESDKAPQLVTYEQSEPLTAGQVSANATNNTVEVTDVAPGTTIIVYDDQPKVIGTATNTGNAFGTVIVELSIDLADGDSVFVSKKDSNKSASVPIEVFAAYTQSAEPVTVVANASTDTVTVTNVPPGATVTVYDDKGDEIGKATNNGETAGTVIVTIGGGLNEETFVKVTITEPNKSESKKTEAATQTKSVWPNDSSIEADGTKGKVTVEHVPAGATIIVYDKDGKELGRLKQGETAGQLTLENLQGMGDQIQVGIVIEGQLESAPKQANVVYTQSAALDESAISVNATNDTVTVTNVPAGAVIKVYDEDGELIGTAANEEDEAGSVVVTITSAGGLTDGQAVDVTITEPNKTESEKTGATATTDQSYPPLLESSITANATDNTVTVTNVPPGATVTVYDEEGEIGTATNNGNTAGPVIVTITGEYDESDSVYVTITEPNKLESEKVKAEMQIEAVWPSESSIEADGTEGTVTVTKVPSGATIIVYDKDGKELGRLTQGETAGPLKLENLEGLADKIQVSIVIDGYLESDKAPQSVTYEQSEPLTAGQVSANATNNTVEVTDVAPGRTIIVYDDDDQLKVIGTATNTGNASGTVIVELSIDLADGDSVFVSKKDSNKAASEPIEVIAVYTQSAKPVTVVANASTDTVTVEGVPAGATVTVYDDKGDEIGTATNNGETAGTVTVTIIDGFGALEKVDVKITEPNKLESLAVQVDILVMSDPLTVERITTNATKDTVQVASVPAGATIYIYNAGNQLIGTITNNGLETADLTIAIPAPGIAGGDTVKVSVKEKGKLESSTVSVIAGLEQTAALGEEQAIVNATKDVITVKHVAPGATVRVYDSTGKLLISRKNTTSGSTNLVIAMNPGFDAGVQYLISVSEPNKLESEKKSFTARDQSSRPTNDQIESISVQQDTIVVKDVPNGATVVVYDAEGKEVGNATNTSGSTGEVTVKGPIKTNELQITIIESGKLESDKLIVDLQLTTEEQINNALRRLSVEYQGQDTWESVTNNVFVLTVGAHDTQVQWQSAKSGVIAINSPLNNRIEATVARQANDVSVILTAEISKNGMTKSRTFLLIVKSESLDKISESVGRQVDIKGGEQQEQEQQVDVNRITMSDGSKIDKAIFDAASAGTFAGNPLTADNPAIIYVNEDTDPADEYAIEIPQQSMSLLADHGNSLEIQTDFARLSMGNDMLAQMNKSFLDLFFRIVPVKNADKQKAINDAIPNESVVRTAAGGRQVEVLGSSLEIETNYSNYNTKLFIPFAKNGIVVPTGNAASFLDSLRIYIEHSDGEKVVQQGTVVYKDGVPVGLEIEINKFSTFTIIQLKSAPVIIFPVNPVDEEEEAEEETPESAHHSAYMKGYTDGTFRPNASVKRSEMASILFRVNELEAEASFKQLYPDVNEGHWASPNIERLNGLGWMIGDTLGNFRPESGITRAEMAMILARWLELELPSEPQSGFDDVGAGHWANQAISAVSSAGYMIGYKEGDFKPNRYLTRAEAVTIINRVLDRGPLTRVPAPSWKDVDHEHWAYGAIEEASRNHFYTKLEGESGEQYKDSK